MQGHALDWKAKRAEVVAKIRDSILEDDNTPNGSGSDDSSSDDNDPDTNDSDDKLFSDSEEDSLFVYPNEIERAIEQFKANLFPPNDNSSTAAGEKDIESAIDELQVTLFDIMHKMEDDSDTEDEKVEDGLLLNTDVQYAYEDLMEELFGEVSNGSVVSRPMVINAIGKFRHTVLKVGGLLNHYFASTEDADKWTGYYSEDSDNNDDKM